MGSPIKILVIVYCVTILAFSSTTVSITDDPNQMTVSCAVPQASADKNVTIFDVNDQPIEITKLGPRVPKRSYIDIQCTKGYLFSDGSDLSTSFCRPNRKGEWQPPIKACLRSCPSLQTSNVELKCKFNGHDIDCNGPLLSGTVVTPRCKVLHHITADFNPDYTTIQCRKEGTWSRKLFRCDPDCGIPKHETLTIGGKDATIGQFPWHVAIYSIPRDYLLICSGTLITSSVVLSAAHCFYSEALEQAKTTPTDYVVTVGKMTRNFTKIDNEVQKTFEISEILFSEKPFNPIINGYTADIALMILKERVTVSTFVLPACFRAHYKRLGFNPGTGAMGVLAGWGLDETGNPTEHLKMIRLPFIQHSECVKKLTGVTQDKFCAGADKGPRPQQGDSGGGLVFKDLNTFFYYVRGIVSSTEALSETAITTFTDISYYQDWIDLVIQNKTGSDQHPEIVDSQTARPVDKFGPQNEKYPTNDRKVNNTTKYNESNPLHSAAINGTLDVIKLLVEEKKADVNAKNNEGETPVNLAARFGHLNIVKYLADEKKANISIKGDEGRDAFLWAVAEGKLDIVKYLVEKKNADINAKDKNGDTMVNLATRSGRLNIVKYLVDEKKVNIDIKGHLGRNTLLSAVFEGKLDILKYLVEKKNADVNSKDEEGETALNLAARVGHLNILKYLIDEKKMNVNSTGFKARNALLSAVSTGKLDVVKYLLEEKNADINATDKNGDNALTFGAWYGHLNVIKYLVDEKKWVINIRGFDGRDALLSAAAGGKVDVVKYLVEKKNADINVRDKDGETAVQLAVRYGHLDTVTYLLNAMKKRTST